MSREEESSKKEDQFSEKLARLHEELEKSGELALRNRAAPPRYNVDRRERLVP